MRETRKLAKVRNSETGESAKLLGQEQMTGESRIHSNTLPCPRLSLPCPPLLHSRDTPPFAPPPGEPEGTAPPILPRALQSPASEGSLFGFCGFRPPASVPLSSSLAPVSESVSPSVRDPPSVPPILCSDPFSILPSDRSIHARTRSSVPLLLSSFASLRAALHCLAARSPHRIASYRVVLYRLVPISIPLRPFTHSHPPAFRFRAGIERQRERERDCESAVGSEHRARGGGTAVVDRVAGRRGRERGRD